MLKRSIAAALLALILASTAIAQVNFPGGSPNESFGAKLRRLAGDAANNNPVINPPMIVPSAWGSGQTIVKGQLESNAGSWFVPVGAGTTGVTAPTVTTDGNSHSDGGVGWTYYGGPNLSASSALAPTVTASASSGIPPASLLLWTPTSLPSLYRTYGGNVSVINTNQWQSNAFNIKAGTANSSYARYAFYTDAPKFAISTANGCDPSTRVTIDNQLYSVANTPFTTGAKYNWLLFDFSAVQQRKAARLVIKETGSDGNGCFGGVATSALDMVWAPSTQDDVRAIFIGDSMLSGSNFGPMLAGGDVPNILGRLLGWSDVWNWGVGGTGWQTSTANYNFLQRVQDSGNQATLATANIVLFQGSTNDIGASAATITANAVSAFQTVRQVNPNCIIIVFGLWPISNSSNFAAVQAVETAVQAAVTQFAASDNKIFFIPISNDPVIPWVTGAWNNSANTNSVTAPMYMAGDNVHPPDIGSLYMARRFDRAIRSSVLPFVQ